MKKRRFPEGLLRVNSILEFYYLLPRKKVCVECNMEPVYGTEYYLYSPSNKKGWWKTFEEYTNKVELKRFIKDGNVFKRNSQGL